MKTSKILVKRGGILTAVMQELCDYEKRRLRNVKKNIEIMKTLGKILLHSK